MHGDRDNVAKGPVLIPLYSFMLTKEMFFYWASGEINA